MGENSLVDLTKNLKSLFGFESFLPGQAEAVQSLLDSKHVIVVMPTGSGKSLIFQLAAQSQRHEKTKSDSDEFFIKTKSWAINNLCRKS